MTSKPPAAGARPTLPVGGDSPSVTDVRGFGLEVVGGPGNGASWESTSASCLIGSNPSCDLSIADETVSRFHCEITIGQGAARIRDLESKNGVVVDGVRIVDGYLKSGSLITLGASIVRFTHQGRTTRIPVSERRFFGRLIGESVAMRTCFGYLERVAHSDVRVLLEGETGTGKSIAARSVHMEGPRKAGPFVAIDCGALPPNLMETELFGHARGAFTGADRDRAGVFEEASLGTLFLDEIGELPLELQPKLLSVLEERQVRRVGEAKSRPIDTRIIAATNRDLRKEVNAGRFREDLYFRLAVIRIQLPPLRSRTEDIPHLAKRILDDLGADSATIDRLTSGPAAARLRGCAWAGNVRELRNILEQAFVFDELVDVAPDASVSTATQDPLKVDITLPFSEAKKRAAAAIEREYVRALLRAHNGVVVDAAQAAGIDRTYLYRLMRRHRLGDALTS